MNKPTSVILFGVLNIVFAVFSFIGLIYPILLLIFMLRANVVTAFAEGQK